MYIINKIFVERYYNILVFVVVPTVAARERKVSIQQRPSNTLHSDGGLPANRRLFADNSNKQFTTKLKTLNKPLNN